MYHHWVLNSASWVLHDFHLCSRTTFERIYIFLAMQLVLVLFVTISISETSQPWYNAYNLVISIGSNKEMVTNTSFKLDKQPTITQWRWVFVLRVKGWQRHSFPAWMTLMRNYQLQHRLTVMETQQLDGRTHFCNAVTPIFHTMTLSLVSQAVFYCFSRPFVMLYMIHYSKKNRTYLLAVRRASAGYVKWVYQCLNKPHIHVQRCCL